MERSRSGFESGSKGDVGEEVAEISISEVESDREIRVVITIIYLELVVASDGLETFLKNELSLNWVWDIFAGVQCLSTQCSVVPLHVVTQLWSN